MTNLPVLFSQVPGADLPEEEFLVQHALRITLITHQSAFEIGRSLVAVRDRFKHETLGPWQERFLAWTEGTLGYKHSYVYRLMEIFEAFSGIGTEEFPDMSIKAQYQLARAPEPGDALDEAQGRASLEERITERVAREIADYQRAERVARDTLKTTQERAQAVEFQLTYVKQQLAVAKQKMEQMTTPQVVEKQIRVEVVPEHIQEHVTLLEERARQLARERDSYRKQLEDERTVRYAKDAERREGEYGERVRALFAEGTRDFVRATRIFLSRLPSVSDTDSFDADDWQRITEVTEVLTILSGELTRFDRTRTSSQDSQTSLLIVDAG